MEKLETYTPEEVAKMLGTTPNKIRYAILNGTMPVGLAVEGRDNERSRTIILKSRFELWCQGADLGCAK
jgi:hypothetical protein